MVMPELRSLRMNQGPNMLIESIKFLAQAAIAASAAFLAAYLASKRFKNEALWKKKVDAYESLIHALHGMRWHIDENLQAEMEHRELSKEDSAAYWEEFKQSRRECWRIADTSDLLISPRVRAAIAKLDEKLSAAASEKTYFEYLDSNSAAINECLKELKRIGRQELGIKAGSA